MADFKVTLFRNERIYMVDFARAKTGPPHHQFPDVDNTGYQDLNFPDEHGRS